MNFMKSIYKFFGWHYWEELKQTYSGLYVRTCAFCHVEVCRCHVMVTPHGIDGLPVEDCRTEILKSVLRS